MVQSAEPERQQPVGRAERSKKFKGKRLELVEMVSKGHSAERERQQAVGRKQEGVETVSREELGFRA